MMHCMFAPWIFSVTTQRLWAEAARPKLADVSGMFSKAWNEADMSAKR